MMSAEKTAVYEHKITHSLVAAVVYVSLACE